MLLYLGCILLLGIPGMVSEFIVGRHSQANAYRAYASITKSKAWGFVGILGILTSTIILGLCCGRRLVSAVSGRVGGRWVKG